MAAPRPEFVCFHLHGSKKAGHKLVMSCMGVSSQVLLDSVVVQHEGKLRAEMMKMHTAVQSTSKIM